MHTGVGLILLKFLRSKVLQIQFLYMHCFKAIFTVAFYNRLLILQQSYQIISYSNNILFRKKHISVGFYLGEQHANVKCGE